MVKVHLRLCSLAPPDARAHPVGRSEEVGHPECKSTERRAGEPQPQPGPETPRISVVGTHTHTYRTVRILVRPELEACLCINRPLSNATNIRLVVNNI